MYVFYDATGKIVGCIEATAPIEEGVFTPQNTTALYLDDTTYTYVWDHPADYTIQNEEPVSAPVPDSVKLSGAQKAKLAQIEQSFGQSLYTGFQSSADGTQRTYAIDPTAMAKWSAALSVINSGKGPTSLSVKDFSGNQVTLTVAQFQQMASDGFTFFNNQEQHLWTLENQVNSATTVNEVNAITW